VHMPNGQTDSCALKKGVAAWWSGFDLPCKLRRDIAIIEI